jgi:hypothetical protein
MNRKVISMIFVGLITWSSVVFIIKLNPNEKDSTLILINQNGYLPMDNGKRVFLQIDALFDGYEFGVPYNVINLTSNQFNIVLTGNLSYLGILWGHHYFNANISEIRSQGSYKIEVNINGNMYNSYSFSIADDVYVKTFEYSYVFYYYQRCGCQVKQIIPGPSYTGHPACHLDDANLQEDQENPNSWRNLTGAWHDAGDYNKYNCDTIQSLYSLIQSFEQNSVFFQAQSRMEFYPNSTMCSYHSNLIPDIVEEAIWGADFLVKCTYEDGRMVADVGSNDLIGWYGYWGRPSEETDNNNATPRDNRKYTTFAGYPVLGAIGLMKLSRMLNNYGWFPEKVQLYNETALKIFNHYLNPEYHSVDTLLSYLELYKGTGNITCLSKANEIAYEIMASSSIKTPEFSQTGVDFTMYALAEWATVNGSINAKNEVENAFETRWTYFWEPMAFSSDPTNFFNLLKANSTTHGIFYFYSTEFPGAGDWNVGQNSYYLSAASAALFAYNFTRDEKYLNFALRQLDWIFGFNPFALCMMEGIGSLNPPKYHNRLDTEPGNFRGAIPGSVTNGMIRLPAQNNEITPDEPWFDLSQPFLESVTSEYQSNEPWLPHNSNYLLTASMLENVFK